MTGTWVGEGVGVYPHLFYNKARHEVDTVEEGAEVRPDPREHFMDRPDAAPDDLNREVDLDG